MRGIAAPITALYTPLSKPQKQHQSAVVHFTSCRHCFMPNPDLTLKDRIGSLFISDPSVN